MDSSGGLGGGKRKRTQGSESPRFDVDDKRFQSPEEDGKTSSPGSRLPAGVSEERMQRLRRIFEKARISHDKRKQGQDKDQEITLESSKPVSKDDLDIMLEPPEGEGERLWMPILPRLKAAGDELNKSFPGEGESIAASHPETYENLSRAADLLRRSFEGGNFGFLRCTMPGEELFRGYKWPMHTPAEGMMIMRLRDSTIVSYSSEYVNITNPDGSNEYIKKITKGAGERVWSDATRAEELLKKKSDPRESDVTYLSVPFRLKNDATVVYTHNSRGEPKTSVVDLSFRNGWETRFEYGSYDGPPPGTDLFGKQKTYMVPVGELGGDYYKLRELVNSAHTSMKLVVMGGYMRGLNGYETSRRVFSEDGLESRGHIPLLGRHELLFLAAMKQDLDKETRGAVVNSFADWLMDDGYNVLKGAGLEGFRTPLLGPIKASTSIGKIGSIAKKAGEGSAKDKSKLVKVADQIIDQVRENKRLQELADSMIKNGRTHYSWNNKLFIPTLPIDDVGGPIEYNGMSGLRALDALKSDLRSSKPIRLVEADGGLVTDTCSKISGEEQLNRLLRAYNTEYIVRALPPAYDTKERLSAQIITEYSCRLNNVASITDRFTSSGDVCIFREGERPLIISRDEFMEGDW